MSTSNTKTTSGSLVLNDSEQRPIKYVTILLRLLGYLFRYPVPVAATIAMMLVYSGTVVIMPWLVKLAIDEHIVTGSGDVAGLSVIVGLYLVAAMAQFISGYIHRRIFVKLGQQMLYEMRLEE